MNSVRIEDSWKSALADEFQKDYFRDLAQFVRESYLSQTVFPAPKDVFRAFDLCTVERVKVVILGQDPYHGVGQAQGLCFSVPTGVVIPPSLVNIYKEIVSDVGTESSTHGDLTSWAEQGVLLLNATLTVQAGMAGSHQGRGWERFTDAVIRYISDEKEHVVFLLWGRYAQEKGKVIDTSKHLVLKAAHPSPLSAYNGFFGCRHFILTNEYLVEHEREPINW